MPRPPQSRRPHPSTDIRKGQERAERQVSTPPLPGDNDAQQHDLHPAAAQRVITASGQATGEQVLEVGAGLGALTAVMLARGATVHAIERDEARVTTLRARFAAELGNGRLHLHAADARTFVPPLMGAWRVVANPPFGLTALLVQRWLVAAPAPVAIDLVLQRQAAEKLAGLPDAQTRSSVLVNLVGRSHVALRLFRGDTEPPSRVDLCLWSFRRSPDAPTAKEMAHIDRLLTRAFAGPHTMTDALRGLASGIQLRRQGQEHGWNPNDHPRTLPVAAWRPLAALLAMCGKI